VSKHGKALRAIIARIQGGWDQPDLLEYGPLGDMKEDILSIAETALSAKFLGQDRDSYSDDQDRESYMVDPRRD